MTKRHPAIDSEDSSDDREPLAREIEGFERRNARLLFVVDLEIGGRGKNGAALGGVPVAGPRGLRRHLDRNGGSRVVNP
jgi:hypothetical protein